MTVQCCKCKRVRAGTRWVQLEGAVEGAVTHSYCEVCADQFRIQLFSEIASMNRPWAIHYLGNLIATASARVV